MSQYQPFDTTIKSIFKEDAAEILPHLLPGITVVEVLDIEVLRPPMRVDRVYRVLYKGKPHILEVEVQAGADEDIEYRALVYHANLLRDYRLPVISLINYLFQATLPESPLAEVEALCDSVGILRKGELILSGTVADLLHTQDVVEIVLANHRPASDVVTLLDIEQQVIEAQGNLLRIVGKGQATILAALVNNDIAITSLNPLAQTLEEVYVETTRKADDAAIATTTGKQEQGGRA
ncbi:MAG: hypothetical protein ACYDER_17600 [Ktedonobacteraceae bacterium]